MSSFKKELKKYELPPLPYKLDALEPYVSAQIMDVHYNGHHKGYVNAANTTVEKVEKIIKGEAAGYDLQGVVRNLVFNINGHKLHSIFWNNMGPAGSKGGGKPGGVLADLINKQYGNFDRFKAVFNDVMKSLTGTGWAVLYFDPETNKLTFTTVENHFINQIIELPVVMIVDEFEHAYYLQYKNNRNAYLDAWWNVVNWEDAERNLQKHLG
ncbi:MAG: superoxide dismutase [Thermoprotei archaeon]